MTDNLSTLLSNMHPASSLSELTGQALAAELGELSDLQVYPPSITPFHHSVFFLGRQGEKKFLGILCTDSIWQDKFTGSTTTVNTAGGQLKLTRCVTTPENAAVLRTLLPFLVAQTLGLRKSAGCGDRLGLATPGHIRAIRHSSMAPILPQQSMRENARTGRTPQEVMDDAMWGVFQEGWRDGFGADADHLKTTADIDLCAAAGYTFYTVDPGEYVDNSASTVSPSVLQAKLESSDWHSLETDQNDLQCRLADRPLDLGEFKLTIGSEELLRASAKYGRAVAHTARMYRHLSEVMGSRPFELEMSVDETETVTTLAEHIYVANELKRLGVRWVSLAPRYVGTFEKGVDYIGDLAEFQQSLVRHLAVAKTYGPYKLSLHSGSDKFSIYPIAARVAGDLIHLKTAGTSYLEALRAIATLEPALFREIVTFAKERYPTDRASYHVSAEVEKVPDLSSLADTQLGQVLDQFHCREVLHVTFGSVLNHTPFREPFFKSLRENEETYYQMLEAHFDKHLRPFN